MRFTMARPEVSCHPESLLPGARYRRLCGALLLRSGAGACDRGEGRLPRYTWRDAYAELRAKLDELGRRLGGAYRVLVDANDHVDREGAARAGDRLLRKEHDADHAAARLVGRPRDARHRCRDRAEPPSRARLRRVHALHRRLPDRRSRRARRARFDALPVLLDAGAGGDPRALSGGARRPGLRLRHLPGRVPVEPRSRAQAAGRAPARRGRARRVSRRMADDAGRRAAPALRTALLPATTPATCAGTRSWPSETPVAPSSPRLPSHMRAGEDELLRDHASWALDRLRDL